MVVHWGMRARLFPFVLPAPLELVIYPICPCGLCNVMSIMASGDSRHASSARESLKRGDNWPRLPQNVGYRHSVSRHHDGQVNYTKSASAADFNDEKDLDGAGVPVFGFDRDLS